MLYLIWELPIESLIPGWIFRHRCPFTEGPERIQWQGFRGVVGELPLTLTVSGSLKETGPEICFGPDALPQGHVVLVSRRLVFPCHWALIPKERSRDTPLGRHIPFKTLGLEGERDVRRVRVYVGTRIQDSVVVKRSDGDYKERMTGRPPGPYSFMGSLYRGNTPSWVSRPGFHFHWWHPTPLPLEFLNRTKRFNDTGM